MIVDHIGSAVGDLAASKAFYAKALAPLGIAGVTGGDDWAMFGKGGKPKLWIGTHGRKPDPIHLAFAAATRDEVRAFHAAALDNGAPGLRPQYHPDYYAAFALDSDGHNVEAVCHALER